MKPALRTSLLAILLPWACGPAEDVTVQELPPLERSSIESRLGLPELRGPWRFAGWELQEGDSLGMEAELPAFGVLFLQTQKRDSLAGTYLTAGGGRAPLQGEVRRDSVVALVALTGPEEGRFLVGQVAGDTLWVEATTLAEPGSWRGDARAAFVRSQTAVTPFRRVRGALAAAPPVDSAGLAIADSLAQAAGGVATGAGAVAGGVPAAGAGATQPGATPAVTPRTQAPAAAAGQAAPAVTRPALQEEEEEEAPVRMPERAEDPPAPRPEVQREPPRVLGVPVVRDTSGGGNLP